MKNLKNKIGTLTHNIWKKNKKVFKNNNNYNIYSKTKNCNKIHKSYIQFKILTQQKIKMINNRIIKEQKISHFLINNRESLGFIKIVF